MCLLGTNKSGQKKNSTHELKGLQLKKSGRIAAFTHQYELDVFVSEMG